MPLPHAVPPSLVATLLPASLPALFAPPASYSSAHLAALPLSTCLPVCLHAYLPSYLSINYFTYLSSVSHLPPSLATLLPLSLPPLLASLSPFRPTNMTTLPLPACLSTCLPVFLHASLPPYLPSLLAWLLLLHSSGCPSSTCLSSYPPARLCYLSISYFTYISSYPHLLPILAIPALLYYLSSLRPLAWLPFL